MNIIGFAAQMRAGKDESANYLVGKLPGWGRSSLAQNVKQIFCQAFDVDLDFLEEWKTKPDIPPGFLKNVRASLQFIGDGFRQIKSTVWMDLAFNKQNDKLIFSDVRYINEMKKIKELGGFVVLLWRPGFENDDPNGSEAQVKPLIEFCKNKNKEGPISYGKEDVEGLQYVDYFIRNEGTIEDLNSKLDQLTLYLNNFGDQ